MSTWQSDLVALILAVPAVSAITDQVFWGQAVSGRAGQHVVLRQVAGPRDVDHGGQLTLGGARVEINSYGATAAEAAAMRDGINNALVGKSFITALGNAPASGNQFPSILHGNDIDFPEPIVDLFRATTDLNLTYRLAA